MTTFERCSKRTISIVVGDRSFEDDDWELTSNASTASAWELVSPSGYGPGWKVLGALTFKEAVLTPGARPPPICKAVPTMARLVRTRKVAPKLEVVQEEAEVYDYFEAVGTAEMDYAQRTRRSKQSAESRAKRIAQKMARSSQ